MKDSTDVKEKVFLCGSDRDFKLQCNAPTRIFSLWDQEENWRQDGIDHNHLGVLDHEIMRLMGRQQCRISA